ncbi:transposase [Streptomyces sp. NBC_00233]|uniref:transposase n=1 Tax=Streptomyces sp. NBC_00233 TaxID=2975686 RepID=UPI002255A4D4|nr:transposase [Streptomyces sp. NBC_00233]MCX5233262.1 transposase [Streptomyces sp. NBC_00233]
MSRKSTYRWHRLWREGGAQALVSRGLSGSRCGLSPYRLEKLAGFLQAGPTAHGWVEVPCLLQRLGCYEADASARFQLQVPARRIAARDEQAVGRMEGGGLDGDKRKGGPRGLRPPRGRKSASPDCRGLGVGEAAPRS